MLAVIMPFLPVRDEGEIYDNTIRLHILANSDSTDDQILKIRVRDAILEKTKEIANGCCDVESAKEIYPELKFLPTTHFGYVPCLCGKSCEMVCYRHLKEEGVL